MKRELKNEINNLTDLGDVVWKEALKENLYYSHHLFTRIPNSVRDLFTGDTIRIPLSNKFQGVKFNIIFNREFLLAKLNYFFTRFFYSKEEFLAFCEESWDYSRKERLDSTISLIGNHLKDLEGVDLNTLRNILELHGDKLVG